MGSLTIPRALRVEGEAIVPGDKAISHRALILAAHVRGSTTIQGLSTARDVASTLSVLHSLSIVESSEESQSLLEGSGNPRSASTFLKLEGKGWDSRAGGLTLDCGNSGSTMRMLMGALAGPGAGVVLVGDESLSRRPMKRVAHPIRTMGATIELGKHGTPPVEISGAALEGIDYTLPVASAQVKTAVMFAGLQAEGATVVREPSRTRDHTERMLSVLARDPRRDGLVTVERTELFGDKAIDIPGDFSSASFLLSAAALLPGSHLMLKAVGTNPTRTAFLELLRRFGANVVVHRESERSGEPRADLEITASERRGFDVPVELVPSAIDELPLVAVLGCFAEGTTRVHGAAELRVKESDRIAAITQGLRAMGAQIEDTPDGFVVRGPSPLHGAEVDAHGDHRIAMALAVAALGAESATTIVGWEAADVSYPGFADALRSVTVPRSSRQIR